MSYDRGMVDLFKHTSSDGLLNFTKLFWIINDLDKGDAMEHLLNKFLRC